MVTQQQLRSLNIQQQRERQRTARLQQQQIQQQREQQEAQAKQAQQLAQARLNQIQEQQNLTAEKIYEIKQLQNFISRGKTAEIMFAGTDYQKSLLKDLDRANQILSNYQAKLQRLELEKEQVRIKEQEQIQEFLGPELYGVIDKPSTQERQQVFDFLGPQLSKLAQEKKKSYPVVSIPSSIIGVGGLSTQEIITTGKEILDYRKEFRDSQAYSLIKKADTRLTGFFKPSQEKISLVKDVEYKPVTQAAWELAGTEFYQPDERQRLVEEGLKNLTEADTYESQQEAIENLKSKNISVKRVLNKEGEEVWEIDVEKAYKVFAPTSKLGNVLVGVSDIFFKSTLFSPYMAGAGAKKGKVKGSEQKVVYRRKFGKKTDIELSEEALKRAEASFKKGKLPDDLKKWAKEIKPEARENFAEYLKELSDKGLIKGPYAYNIETGTLSLDLVKPATATGPFASTDPFVSSVKGPTIPAGEITTATAPSQYAGTGMYERYSPTENLFVRTGKPSTDEKLGTNIFEGTAPTGRTETTLGGSQFGDLGQTGRIKTGILEAEGQALKTRQDILSAQVSKTSQKTQAALRIQEALKEQIRQQPRLRSALISLQSPGVQQKLQQKLIQKARTGFKPKPRPRLKPRPTTIPKPIPFNLDFDMPKDKYKKLVGKEESSFGVYVKRFGKDVKIGEGLTLLKAKQLLKSRLTKTLRASGYVQRRGQRVKIDLGPQFRPGKKQPKRIVQKRKFRLATIPERREIQLFKKYKSSKRRRK